MVPSLGKLCEFPVVNAFSTHPNIRNQIFTSSTKSLKFHSKFEKWSNDLQNVVTETFKEYNPVFELTIQTQLFPLNGIQMLIFAENLRSSYGIPKKFTKLFIKCSFFTSKGLIDEGIAIRDLLKDSSLDMYTRFKIACNFYLEDVAQNLYQQLREDSEFKNFVYNKKTEVPVLFCIIYFELLLNSSVCRPKFELSDKITIKVVPYLALAICNMPKFMFKEKEVSDTGKSILDTYFQISSIYFEKFILTREMIFSRNFMVHRNTIVHFVKFVEKENFALFLSRYNLVYGYLKSLLIWPLQDLFLTTAVSVFHILNEEHFYRLLHHIVDLIDYPVLNHSCNYRLLLEEFWIKSPLNLKQFVINVESDEITFDFSLTKSHCIPIINEQRIYLLQRIITLTNFSLENVKIIQLILQNATSEEKYNILYINEIYVIDDIVILKHFKLAELFIKVLTTNRETLKEFIKNYILHFFEIFEKNNWCFDVADQFLNCLFSSDEIPNMKEIIFQRVFDDYPVPSSVLFSKCPFTHFNKICAFFGKTEEEIEEWKLNGAFETILTNALPKIVSRLYRKDIVLERHFYMNIIKMCFERIDRLREYIDELHNFCQFYIGEKVCTLCVNNSDVSYDNDELRYICELHSDDKILDQENVDEICSDFKNKLLLFLPKNKSSKLSKLLSIN